MNLFQWSLQNKGACGNCWTKESLCRGHHFICLANIKEHQGPLVPSAKQRKRDDVFFLNWKLFWWIILLISFDNRTRSSNMPSRWCFSWASVSLIYWVCLDLLLALPCCCCCCLAWLDVTIEESGYADSISTFLNCKRRTFPAWFQIFSNWRWYKWRPHFK